MRRTIAKSLILSAILFNTAGCVRDEFSAVRNGDSLVFTATLADATRTAVKVDGTSGKGILDETLFIVTADHGGTPSGWTTVAFDALNLNIGQDGTGSYSKKMAAQLDEMIIVRGILKDTEIAAMKEHYK